MHTRHIWAGAWLLMATLGACEIHEEGYSEGWADGGGYYPPGDYYGDPAICSDYCSKLVSCGAVELGDFDACMGVCNASFGTDPGSTESACLCTLQQSCDEVEDEPCEGTPVPPGDGSGGAGGDGAGGLGAGGDGAGGDGAGGDGGGPAGQPCTASCECPQGESCVEGYCTAGEPPPPSCETNCDCPAGEVCQAGACTAA
jgi:Cys-rich repeat protein